MKFGVLGPLEVTTSRGIVDLGGARQRRLLAAMVAHVNQAVSTERLVDIVFEEDPSASASTTIRSYVARLRRALDAAEPGTGETIVTERGGYSLRIETGSIDAVRFEAAIETARRQLADRDAVAATTTLREGLGLWRGDAYGEFAVEEWARPAAARVDELRTVAQEELNDALLACGLAHDVVSATRGLIHEHPLREKLRSQHMLALHRAGRQAEALRSLADYKQILIDVGLEPSDELLGLGSSVAAQDPALRLDSPAGQPLRGYRIGAAMGDGAHGIVYRAVQPGLGREVAIKTIRAQLADDPAFIRRFDAEAQLVAHLEHPHIVPIYDYWREPGGAYIVMRLVAANLDERLASGPLDIESVARFAQQLGSALIAAHRAGVVHGDIKPTNVLIDEDSVFLADFGVATLIESVDGDSPTVPSSGYESPELLASERPTASSDQFALAVLLVQLLTGTLPFGTRAIATRHDRSPSIHVRRPSVPAEVDDAIWKATAWDSTDRFVDVEAFVESFVAALGGRASQERRSLVARNPYKGLHAFTESDQADFHGRNTFVDELVAHLGRPGADGRFVVAIGASGSGKSSAVRAGLMPRLRAGAIPGSDRWLHATMVPGTDPFSEFEAALRAIATRDPHEESPDTREDRFSPLLRNAVPSKQPVMLVIDQLEELFTLVTDDSIRRAFIDGLTRAVLDDTSGLHVVATLRADFLDRPLRYAEFGRLVKRGAVTIVGMSAPELEAAITQPAAGAGVEVEPALATQVVADVIDQPAALPLLQFTLTELFDQAAQRMMTLEAYASLGGVDGAVAGRADSIYGALSAADREHARRLFLRLVVVDESNAVGRRRALRSQLRTLADDPAEMDAVIDAFGSARLLTFDRDPESREPTVEVAHEALIQHWPRFRDWVSAAGEGLRVQQQIASATRTWLEHGRDSSDLARGMRLESALDLLRTSPDAMNHLERDFVTASEAQRTAEAEAQRERTQRDQRNNRRLRGLLAGVGLMLVVSLIAGFLAVRQRDRADESAAAADAAAEAARSLRDEADEQAAAAESLRADADQRAALESVKAVGLTATNLADTDPMAAMLVAIEGTAMADDLGLTSPEVMTGLWESTRRNRRVGGYTVESPLFFAGHLGSISPDGSRLAVVQGSFGGPEVDRSTEIIDIATGEAIRQLDDEGLGIYAGWDATLDFVVTTNSSGQLTWWDPDSGEVVDQQSVNDGTIWHFAETAERIAYSLLRDPGTGASTAFIVERSGGAVVAEIPNAHWTSFSHDGRYAATSTTNGKLVLTDAATGEELYRVEHDLFPIDAIPGAAWFADAHKIWLLRLNGTLAVLDVASGVVSDPRPDSFIGVTPLKVSPSSDGSLLAIADADTSVYVYDAETYGLVAKLDGHDERVRAVEWALGDEMLVSMDESGDSITWVTAPRSASSVRFVRNREIPITHAQFENDLVMHASRRGRVEVWDTRGGELVADFELADEVNDIFAHAHEASGLIAGPSDEGIYVFDVQEQEVVAEHALEGVDQPVTFSADGNLLLASTSPNGFINGRVSSHATVIIDNDTGAVLQRWDGIRANNGVFTSDGSHLVIVGSPEVNGPMTSVLVYDVASGALIADHPLDAPANAIDVSSDDARIALGFESGDRSVATLDLQIMIDRPDEDPVLALTEVFTVGIADLTFSPDGTQLFSGDNNGLLTAWRSDDLQPMWTISNGFVVTELRVSDSLIQFAMATDIPAGLGEGGFGLVAIPIDQTDFADFAASTISRNLTADECDEHLGRPCALHHDV